MAFSCIGAYNRPTIFDCVANGLASSSLNPIYCNNVAAPLRFVAALVVAVVSPLFAVFDLIICLTAGILFSINGSRHYAIENLQDCGILLLRVIPETLCFPFVFAYAPGLYGK